MALQKMELLCNCINAMEERTNNGRNISGCLSKLPLFCFRADQHPDLSISCLLPNNWPAKTSRLCLLNAVGRLIGAFEGTTYAYDAAGRLLSRTQSGQTTSFTRDARSVSAHRLRQRHV